MKKKIFVIEDDYEQFMILESILLRDEFIVYPTSKSEFNHLIDTIQKILSQKSSSSNHQKETDLKEFLIKELAQQKPDAIICDLKLTNDHPISSSYDSEGHMIIDFIRNQPYNEDHVIPEFIPILAFSQYSQLGIKPTSNGVAFMPKFFGKYYENIDSSEEEGRDETPSEIQAKEDLLIAKLNYLINDFRNNQKIVQLMKPQFEEYKRQLINHNKMVDEKIGSVEFMLKGNQNEVLKHLELIFMAIYHGFDNSQQRKFKKEFENEIQKLVGEDKYISLRTIDTAAWNKFQCAFSDINKAQGFEKFIATVVDLLDEQGLLDSFPGGKIAGIALKGIVGLLASGGNIPAA